MLGYPIICADLSVVKVRKTSLEATMEEPPRLIGPTKIVSDEAEAASEVKSNYPIMVIIGNPPYSNFGQMNQGDFILGLLDDYKKNLDEKKLNLDDDYIKFIRWAQWRIEQTGQGVLAFITNHTYLDGITHRQMRKSLMETFDEIYVLDLHGNVRRGETSPDGSPDENVFDIQQGVAIGIFIKTPEGSGYSDVHHSELWGSRDHKYAKLTSGSWPEMEWEEVEPRPEFFFFKPLDYTGMQEYEAYPSITDAFRVYGNGIGTDRDDLFYSFSKETLAQRFDTFYSTQGVKPPFSEDYRVENSSSYPILERRKATEYDTTHLRPCTYRPFDKRWLYYNPELVSRAAHGIMKHLVYENLALLVTRQLSTEHFYHAFAADSLVDRDPLSVATRERTQVFPMFLYPSDDTSTLFDTTTETSNWQTDPDHGNRVPNLSKAFVENLEDKLGISFDPHKTDSVPGDAFGPRDVLAYIYAIFHSRTYRERYAEFLKIDFPRVPLTSDVGLFWSLVELGSELIDLHLMEHPKLSNRITSFPVPGDDRVKRRGGFPKFIPAGESRTKTGEVAEKNRVYINLKQYFKGVPKDVWEFQVGGYQVLHKWLKDRKGRGLSYEEKVHWQKVVVALKETMRLMEEIDATIPQWPIE
jgi:predicted helicase